MVNDLVYEFNAKTNEEIIRHLTDAEQKERDLEVKNFLAAKKIAEELAAQKLALKISAYEKLGLSPEEIDALLPKNGSIPKTE